MTKDEIIESLRDMARYPTVTLPRDCEALKAAAELLAQPEEKPVGEWKLVPKTPTPEMLWEMNMCAIEEYDIGLPKGVATSVYWSALAAAPTAPKRTWVHLTNEEHTELAIECGCLGADWVFYGAVVERKVREKNT